MMMSSRAQSVLDNEDNAVVDGQTCGVCSACGKMNYSACEVNVCTTCKCPTCRAPFDVSDEEGFKRLWKLVHDRSPRRRTPHAQNSLGYMYDKGNGVKQDCAEAVKWFRRAAEQGYAKAQANLGNMYDKGEGLKQDHTEAVKWYRLSVKQRFATAQNNLGIMYTNGKAVSQDVAEALKWWQLAAEQGHNDARTNLNTLQ